jgi:hypothetical protein
LRGASLSEPEAAPSNVFLEHFEKNYEKRVEGHIKWVNLQVLSGKILFVGIVGFPTLLILQSSLLGTTSAGALIASIILPLSVGLFFGWIAFLLISGHRVASLNVREKDILVYFLLQAADKYHAFLTEGGKQEFLDDCIADISDFSSMLKRLLANADMPLKLPNISQLTAFNENIKHLIIPALRQRKNYPATPQQRDYSEVFVSLARLFFYEKEYEELPDINKTIADKLKDVQAEPEEEKGKRMRRLLANNRVLLPVSLIGITAIVLFIVYIFRAPNYEPSTYWPYIADNAAQLAVAIVGAWVVLVVAIAFSRTSRAKTKA